ncbi:MAG: hypothetical protein AB1523_11095 [Bacillota bacterium]
MAGGMKRKNRHLATPSRLAFAEPVTFFYQNSFPQNLCQKKEEEKNPDLIATGGCLERKQNLNVFSGDLKRSGS